MYLYLRPLANGRTLYVFPLTFGRARIAIGNDCFLDDGW
jgi:hypothetical protein